MELTVRADDSVYYDYSPTSDAEDLRWWTQLMVTIMAIALAMAFWLGRCSVRRTPAAPPAAAAPRPVVPPAAPPAAAAPRPVVQPRARSIRTQSMVTYQRTRTVPRFHVVTEREQGAWSD